MENIFLFLIQHWKILFQNFIETFIYLGYRPYSSDNGTKNYFLFATSLRCLNGVDSPEKLETQLKDETSQALNVHLAVEEPNLKPEDRLLKGEDRERT